MTRRRAEQGAVGPGHPPPHDPTQNVLQLVEAAIKRQDDLREKESRHVREVMELRAAEAGRIDAIRAVDVAVRGASSAVQGRVSELIGPLLLLDVLLDDRQWRAAA